MLAAGPARAVVAPAPLHQGSVTQTTDIGEFLGDLQQSSFSAAGRFAALSVWLKTSVQS